MKPKRDIEVGDEITFFGVGPSPTDIRTVARVLSRRGGIREVAYANGATGKLRVHEDGTVQSAASSWTVSLRRTEPGDAEVLAERRERNIAADKIGAFNARTAPLTTLRRVLAAMEDPANG